MTAPTIEAPRPPYNPADDPNRAAAEAFYAAHDEAMARRVEVPAQPPQRPVQDPELAAATRAVSRELAQHTLRYAAGQRGDAYVPGKTAWGMAAHNGTGLMSRAALEQLADQGVVERRRLGAGTFLGRVLRPILPTTYHMNVNTANRLLDR